MEAPCHLQGQGPAAYGLHRGGEGGQLLLGAGHGDLAGAVVVDGVGLRELGAEGLHRGVLQLQHRSHGGGLGLGGLLHQLSPGGRPGESPSPGPPRRCRPGRRSPQGEATGQVGPQALFLQGCGGGQLHGEHAGLGVAGLLQLGLGAGKALLGGARAQGVQLLEHLGRCRGALGQLWPMPGYWAPLALRKRMLFYPFCGSFQHRLGPFHDLPHDVGGGLDLLHHGGHLAGEEASSSRSPSTTALRRAPVPRASRASSSRPPYSALA